MHWLAGLIACLLALLSPDLANAQDPSTEKRIAIVIGNAAYPAGALNTAANDAGLIAQTLEAAGFDVVGARDLAQDALRHALRDFLDKAHDSGPDTVAFIYLSGYGLQLEGENYFVPIDARIAHEADIVAQAIRISDYTRPLAALGLRASIVVLDAARPHPFASSSTQLAGGLALVDPEPGMLVAFNTAPDTVAHDGQGAYGPYAQALAEMMREGGLPLSEVFERVRLRVNEITSGAEVPWDASKVEVPFEFFERASDAPPPPVSVEEKSALKARPIHDLDALDAYLAALEQDSLEGYVDFLAAYPDDPMAERVRAIVAARREAITWRRARRVDAPEAYWSYLRRYPRGRHTFEAQRRLAFLAAVLEPPPSFTDIDYEVPRPPPEEFTYVERRVLMFDDPDFAFAPPPPPPLIFLAPPPPEFVVLLVPPPPPIALFVLPIPIYRPVPIWVRRPAHVAPPPPNNVIFRNIHNTVAINNRTNVVTITNRSGQTTTLPPATAPPVAAGAPHPPVGAVGPALPPSVAQRANQSGQGAPPGSAAQPQPRPSQQPGQPPPPQPGHAQPGQPLPGMKGVPMPIVPRIGPAQPGQPGQRGSRQMGQPLPHGQTLPPQTGQQLEQRQQQLEQQPQRRIEQQQQERLRQQQLEQQRQRQIEQQQQQQERLRQQQLEQQRQRQIEQQQQERLHQQQLEQERQRQIEQLRQQQLEQQRQRQIEQQRQQQEQLRQRQLEQQRQQQIQQQRQQPQAQPQRRPQSCGGPGQPACPR